MTSCLRLVDCCFIRNDIVDWIRAKSWNEDWCQLLSPLFWLIVVFGLLLGSSDTKIDVNFNSPLFGWLLCSPSHFVHSCRHPLALFAQLLSWVLCQISFLLTDEWNKDWCQAFNFIFSCFRTGWLLFRGSFCFSIEGRIERRLMSSFDFFQLSCFRIDCFVVWWKLRLETSWLSCSLCLSCPLSLLSSFVISSAIRFVLVHSQLALKAN